MLQINISQVPGFGTSLSLLYFILYREHYREILYGLVELPLEKRRNFASVLSSFSFLSAEELLSCILVQYNIRF